MDKVTLRDLRKQAGKTVAEVAKELNVSKSTYYNYEQGTREINISQVLVLALLFDETAENVIAAQINSQFFQVDSQL